MNALRGRMILVSTLTIGLLSLLWAGPVAAADCALSAPPWGRVGAVFAIEGSGFPASAGVDVELMVDGGLSDEFTVQSDASGAFEITLTPEPIDEGRTTVTAIAGSNCSAEVAFDIIGADDPAPTIEPANAAATDAPDAPRTDADALATGGHGPDRDGWLAFGLILLVGGVLGLLIGGRPPHGRATP